MSYVQKKQGNTDAQELTVGEVLSGNDIYSKSQNKDELNGLVYREMQDTVTKNKNSYSEKSDEDIKKEYAELYGYEKRGDKWYDPNTDEDVTDVLSDRDNLVRTLVNIKTYESDEFKALEDNLKSYDAAISTAKAKGLDSTLLQFKNEGVANGIGLSKEQINKIGAEIDSDGNVVLDKDAKEALKSMFTEEMAQAYDIDLEELRKAIDEENAFSLADQTDEMKRISSAFVEAQGTA